MQVWLLQSRRGGRTCGHLHVRESAGWRCRDAQAEPGAWSVISVWLNGEEGTRPKRDKGMIAVLTGFGFLSSLACVALLAGAVYEWGHRAVALGSVVFAVVFGCLAFAFGFALLKEIRDPTSYRGGWDWW